MSTDASLFLVFLICIIWGYAQGIINIIFIFCAIVGGIFVSSYSSPHVAQYIYKIINIKEIALILSYILVFIIAHFLLRKIGKMIKKFFKILYLGWLDRVIGALFGFFTALLMLNSLQTILQNLLPEYALPMNTDLQQLVFSILPAVEDFFNSIH